MIKALIRSLFYLRSISKSLDKLTILYALELEARDIRLPNPNASDAKVEICYGPKAADLGIPADWRQ